MRTDVVKPRDVFFNPTRFVVPLFQRPYVWSKDLQWEPLWNDITRLIEVIQQHNQDATHFLGAIVIQQTPTALGALPTWNVIDGQQRLTTLQILLDALHGQLEQRDLTQLAGQILPLIENPSDFRLDESDRFKLWPTNRDREGYAAVMAAPAPVDYDAIIHSRLGVAHRFFSESIATWLEDGTSAEQRARMLVPAITDRLEIAAIRLDAQEDAQAIFETLNARGTPLSAADLIKNFVFQNLPGSPQAAEDAYLKYWAEFETEWWEAPVTTGRITNPRASLFLWQWLTARTLEEFPIREVFTQFKHYVNTVAKDIPALLAHIRASADRYRAIIEASEKNSGVLSRVELFSYRVGTLDSEVSRPLIIWLDEPEQANLTLADKNQIVSTLESWFVRRSLVKVSSQGTNRFIIDLLKKLRSLPATEQPAAVADYLASSRLVPGYWPGDTEVRESLVGAKAYLKYRRNRLRMVLEALEDSKRGYPDGKQFAMEPVTRNIGTVEHLMPQKWRKHWVADLTEEQQQTRDATLHQLGNLTLTTQKLNSSLSHSDWATKRDVLDKDVVLLTRDVLATAPDAWDEEHIEVRTEQLIEMVLEIWPVPAGHVGAVAEKRDMPTTIGGVFVHHLVESGILPAGSRLQPRTDDPQFAGVIAIVRENGSLQVGDAVADSPSGAARLATGRPTNGWWWWVLEGTARTLSDVRADYLATQMTLE
ncbi:DUF262 domain-containing protein [Microbacterium sp. NC79]|uniref:GmrSD restriction endonuclease domain-containing protein n=1 Tax=Microbacterium sp. NC79 TaxID=2851009 RepID=UPI001C2B896C|nr:DUF262 domain-containing protein [Microbacterium sp. NC79]MBV0895977.1 DUF262 domain-containing protein [Microbacterium sp. NC79]